MNKLDYIAGMPIHSIERDTLIDELKIIISKNDNKSQYISITNTEAMFFGSMSKTHFDYINNAKFSLCDGIGIKIAAKFHGIKIRRYNGPDVMLDIIYAGQQYGWSHYFLGGKQGVGEQLKLIFTKKYPGAKILGTYSPPFRELTKKEELEMIKSINSCSPDFLWVSLGLPKQENWIMKYKDQLNAKFCVGVGAAFDFHTGNTKRAPKFYRKLGLEWLYRTAFESRLFIRQLRGFNFLFKTIFNNKSNF